MASWTLDPADALRVTESFDLATFDRASTPGWVDGKAAADAFRLERGELLREQQERLFANSREGDHRNVLLVLQGLDTAGKGGIVRHVTGLLDPQGLALRSFGVPTEEERSHHYLWRIKNALPPAGRLGVFDRSHYEDVLVVRVKKLADADWEERYAEINQWEKELVESGTTIVKVALMVSKDEQGRRLLDRLLRFNKQWKYTAADAETRGMWDDYQAVYQDVLVKTSTEWAPWYVIPADNKWYSRLAVTELLTQAMASLKLRWPKIKYNVEEEKQKIIASMDPEDVREVTEEAAKELEEINRKNAIYIEANAAADNFEPLRIKYGRSLLDSDDEPKKSKKGKKSKKAKDSKKSKKSKDRKKKNKK